MQILLTLVFSSVLLVFMAYPAMKIVEFCESKFEISDRMYDISTVVLTVILSLIVGSGLYYL